MSTRRSNSRLIIKPCTCWWKPIRRGDLWEGVWSYEWTCTRSNYLLFCWEGPLASLVGDNCCASFCTKSFPGRKSIAWLHCRSNSTFFFLVFACFVFNLKLCIFWRYRYREMIDNGINVSMPLQERRFYLTSLIFTQIVTIVILLLFIRTYLGSHLLEK